jgi:hypothetical protein
MIRNRRLMAEVRHDWAVAAVSIAMVVTAFVGGAV